MFNTNRRFTYSLQNLLPVLAILCVVIFLLASYNATGPLLEGYQIQSISRGQSYAYFFPRDIARPLSVFPNWIAIGLSQSGINGYWVVATAIALFRIVAVCLLKKRMGEYFWFTLVFVTLLSAWPAALNERFLPAQLAGSLLIFAYSVNKIQWVNPSITFLVALLSFLTYPTLIIVPIFIFIFTKLVTKSTLVLKINTSYFPIFFALINFIIFLILVRRFVPSAYDIQAGGTPTFNNIRHLFVTALANYPIYSMIILFTIFYVLLITGMKLRKAIAVSFFIFMLLPIVSLTYSGSPFHVNDPERILFPVVITLAIIILELTSSSLVKMLNKNSRWMSLFIITLSAILVFTNMVSSSRVLKQNHELVTNLDLALANFPHKNKLLIKDYSGRLGDVNTFFADSLTFALDTTLAIESTQICMPTGINGKQSIIKRYPLPSPPLCDTIVISPDITIVTLNSNWSVRSIH